MACYSDHNEDRKEKMNVRSEIKNGINWLDNHFPGWENKIDLDTLDIGDPCHCIIGQIVGDYSEIFGESLSVSEGIRLGFSLSIENKIEDWEPLEKEWIFAIKECRNQG